MNEILEPCLKTILNDEGVVTVNTTVGLWLDAADAEALYSTLETEVIPAYYSTDENGLPMTWIRRMKNSIATLTPQFSSDRMVSEYLTNIYDYT